MKETKTLVKKAKKGDHEAFIQLIENYEVVLYNMARRFLKEERDIEDALQETILNAYQNLHQLKKNRYFYTWLCRIMMNQCKQYLRKEEWFEEIEENTWVEEPTFTETQELNALIQQLSQRYRIPIVLYFYNGFSIKEIAEILAEPTGTIKSKLSRGKKLLFEMYEKQEGVDQHGTV
ncbi:RNA polymerase sigma factor [Enterococcus alcedinis]|uniref:RNA polymerase subunit sigma-24 n=1 Tax=Enterococcus alcedinis TaxID=1274384 RepID=A0A917N5G9_9ENTE|nr:RNA polymerase sigma factor [Enterococcus alcedinis]MBP2102745.1 RNA polymerase sigma-70 factor (ECF subfamily) [Enterococcus alcedinis]GGI66306.1 RNA polymerase subunit sigma-24 [Enterococcus alcedinis]